MDEKNRQGISKSTLEGYLSEIRQINAQIAQMRLWLDASYQPDTVKSINPVDLKARRASTTVSIDRLEKRLASLIAACRQSPSISYTDKGDFSHIQNTGVTFNAK
jgi:hypothetical protein